MSVTLKHFDALTQRGLKIIPLRENSKIPMCKGWTNWNLLENRSKILQFPNCNLGILLGEIVDVEGDNEEANQIIADLVGDCPHPSYSSTKSVHHLFKTPDKNLSHFRYKEIEFRGYGHQSVIPPSQHQGINYCWVKAFSFPIPEMPSKLVKFYWSKKNSKKKTIKPNHQTTWCSSCQKQQFIHKKRFNLEIQAFQILNKKWECIKCRKIDIRPACRLIKIGFLQEASKNLEYSILNK